MPEVITAGISMETTVYCVIILLLLFVCAVMSGSESALFSINPDESNKLKSENSKEAKTIIHLLSNPRDLLATILIVNNPSDLPEPSKLDRVEEPYIKATIITKADYVGNVMSLCIEKRGLITNQTYLTTERVELNFDMPLAEIVFDFYDRLKTVSKGYASFDYSPIGMRASKLVKLDVLLNAQSVDALSALIHEDNAYNIGKKMCEKLRELIPRQQFDIPIQAAIGAKIIARETIKALRKDVTAKCYGGDISRKRKLLEKQKKGKKRMRQVGNVEIPQEAFMAVLKLND
jgi:GTP-binding protein LepA